MPRPRKPAPKRHARTWGQGSVKEVRPGVWRAWRARTNGQRPSRTFTSEAHAQAWAAGAVSTAPLYVGQWLETWLGLVWPTLAPRSQERYQRAIADCGELAARPLTDTTTDDWQRHTNLLLGRFTRTSVKVWRGIISVAMRAAVERGHIPSNPLRAVRLPRADETPPKAWTAREARRLLLAASGTAHEAWLWFSLMTGVRLGEARALLWADVDLRARTATISRSARNDGYALGPTKTGKVRIIDLPDELVPVLVAHRARQPASSVLVFSPNARPLHASTLRLWLKRCCMRAGVPDMPPHSLRHTYASLALDDRVPIQDIAHQLGHTVQTCQQTYAHWLGAGQRRAANAVGAALVSVSPPSLLQIEQ